MRLNKQGDRRWEGVVLQCPCPYTAAWSDGLFGSCGCVVLGAVMKYVVDAGVVVLMSVRLCRRLY